MKKLCLVAHERTCEESQVKKKINTNSSHRSISYQFAYNKSTKYCNKKKIKNFVKKPLTNKIKHVTIHIRTIMKQIKLLRNEQKCKTSKSRKPCPREKVQ